MLSACHCRLREGRDRKRCDPAFCFVRPANIIICPTSGYIARAAGGWSEPIILRPKRPTPASCLLRTASNTSRQNLPHALALYCSRFKPSNLQPLQPPSSSLLLSIFIKQLRYHDAANRPERTTTSLQNSIKDTRRLQDKPTFPPAVICAHGRLPGDKKYTAPTSKRSYEIRDRNNLARSAPTQLTAVVACGVSDHAVYRQCEGALETIDSPCAQITGLCPLFRKSRHLDRINKHQVKDRRESFSNIFFLDPPICHLSGYWKTQPYHCMSYHSASILVCHGYSHSQTCS